MSRISISISPDLEIEIQNLADREHVSKSEVIRRALALVKISNQLHKQSRSLGIVQDDGKELKAIGKLVGV